MRFVVLANSVWRSSLRQLNGLRQQEAIKNVTTFAFQNPGWKWKGRHSLDGIGWHRATSSCQGLGKRQSRSLLLRANGEQHRVRWGLESCLDFYDCCNVSKTWGSTWEENRLKEQNSGIVFMNFHDLSMCCCSIDKLSSRALTNQNIPKPCGSWFLWTRAIPFLYGSLVFQWN